MTDEHADAESKTASPESVKPTNALPLRTIADAIVALQHGGLVDSDAQVHNYVPIPDLWLGYLLGTFSTAFIQALGKRAADSAVKLPRRVSDLVRKRVRGKGKHDEYHIGIDDGSAAMIAITRDLPDEARLALLDLDVTADEVRGKLLRWDSDTSAWRPDPDD